MPHFPQWPDLRLRLKGLIVVAAPAAATVALACAMYVIGSRSAEAEQWVNRTLQAGEEIQRLRSSEFEISTHVRGYFITGEEGFTLQARQSMAAFDATRQRLADLTADNPAEKNRLDRLAALERSRVERIVSAIARFQWGALRWDQLRAALKSAEGERLEMEAILKAMEEEERSLMELRLHQVESLRASLRAVTATCVFLGVIGGVVISVLFASGVTDRIARLQKNVARLAAGGILEPLPPWHDEIGELSVGVARAAEILRRRTAALEGASNGVAEADATGHYVDFNPAYRQLAGLGEVHSAPGVVETVHPEDRESVGEAIRRMYENGGAEVEARVIRAAGLVVHVGMTFVPVPEREGGYFVFLSDIQRRKEAEAALVRAKDSAVAGSLAKSQFLAKISHEIRTPLNAILGAADLLSESPLNSDQAGYVGMFQRNCRRLVALINDFLDFSKIEAGAVRVENVPYRIRETVEEAVATFREIAYRKGVTLGAEVARDVPEWALGDPLRVHQVLVNLLSNGLKFTQQGGVEVKVWKTDSPEGEQLQFSVSDTGPGIPAEDQQRIFGVFEQSGQQSCGALNGCGLGLAICRQLVELLGGEIGVSSQQGSGSTFHFTFPLTTPQPNVVIAEPAIRVADLPRRVGQQVQVLRVLVAEDTEDNRVLLTAYLRGEPVEVQFVENGLQAVNAICRRGEEVDLILMDLDMPVLDGLGAVKTIRTWEREQGREPVPIVGLSAHAMREAVRECLDAGCVAHVAKPVDRATLLNTVRRYARASVRGGNEYAGVSEEVAALVPKYLASKLTQIEEARASLVAKDFEPIRRFGHNLKGTGQGYGFPRIEVIGSAIEKAALEQDEPSISVQLEGLSRFLADDHSLVPNRRG